MEIINLRRQDNLKKWGEKHSGKKLFGFLAKLDQLQTTSGECGESSMLVRLKPLILSGPQTSACWFQQYPYPRIVGDVPTIQLCVCIYIYIYMYKYIYIYVLLLLYTDVHAVCSHRSPQGPILIPQGDPKQNKPRHPPDSQSSESLPLPSSSSWP